MQNVKIDTDMISLTAICGEKNEKLMEFVSILHLLLNKWCRILHFSGCSLNINCFWIYMYIKKIPYSYAWGFLGTNVG